MGFFEWFDKCPPVAKFGLLTLSSSASVGGLHAFCFVVFFMFSLSP